MKVVPNSDGVFCVHTMFLSILAREKVVALYDAIENIALLSCLFLYTLTLYLP